MKEQEGGSSQKEGCDAGHLGAFEHSENEVIVVSPEIFEKEAGSGVEHDVEGQTLSFGVICATEYEEKGENDEIQLSLPDLSRPEGLPAVSVIGEGGGRIEDAEIRARRRAEGVSIQQICAASQRLPKDDGGSEDVRESPGIQMMTPGIEKTGDNPQQHPALNGHSALPDMEELCEMIRVVIPVKKEDIPQPCPQKTGDTTVDADIHYMFFVAPPVLLCQEIADPRGEDDAEGYDETISPNGELPNVEQVLMHRKPLLPDKIRISLPLYDEKSKKEKKIKICEEGKCELLVESIVKDFVVELWK